MTLTGRTLCGCPADDAEEPGGSGTSQLAHVVIVEDDSGPWSSERCESMCEVGYLHPWSLASSFDGDQALAQQMEESISERLRCHSRSQRVDVAESRAVSEKVMNLVNAGKPQLDNVLLMRMNYGLCSLLWSLDLPFSGWGTLWQETRNGTIGPPGFQKQILP
ncbi:uncharacterized protein LOC141952717 isoform X2 [Strix uralensis]|uniref:uncharacterized protein LOC141952717 isoform X2 n=2 Tax=Strix uralensis TaxID=36305 RepID=UPI003DA60066